MIRTKGDYLYFTERKGITHRILKGSVQLTRERFALARLASKGAATEPQKARLAYLNEIGV